MNDMNAETPSELYSELVLVILVVILFALVVRIDARVLVEGGRVFLRHRILFLVQRQPGQAEVLYRVSQLAQWAETRLLTLTKVSARPSSTSDLISWS
jgi:hypothetical protein